MSSQMPDRSNQTMRIQIDPKFGADLKKEGLGSKILKPVPKEGAAPGWHDVLQSLYDGALILNQEWQVLDANDRALAFLGFTLPELCQISIHQLIAGAQESLSATVKENLEKGRFTYIEAHCLRKNGTTFPAEIVVTRFRHPVDFRVGCFIRDITRRREMEKELNESHAKLLQAEKMAAIGQIAAGVAHEINNPVGFVSSNLTTLRDYIAVFLQLFHDFSELRRTDLTPSQREELLAKIDKLKQEEDIDYILGDINSLINESLEGMERVGGIVANLKNFARVDESEIRMANINDGIESTLKVIWNELKYKCQVDRELGQIPMIRCNPGQLNQVFMNLLLNSAQSIKDKGFIRIKTALVAGQVMVCISDSGCGISKENMAKIFTPFFTTKPEGKGTGLGLSISNSIIRRHGGSMEVESEEGKGSTFTIRLPETGIPL